MQHNTNINIELKGLKRHQLCTFLKVNVGIKVPHPPPIITCSVERSLNGVCLPVPVCGRVSEWGGGEGRLAKDANP